MINKTNVRTKNTSNMYNHPNTLTNNHWKGA